MKKLLTLFAAIVIVTPTALLADTPELPMIDGSICYTEVVTVDSVLTQSDLYTRSRQWFAQTYKSANNVIQMDNENSGVIMGKALMQVYHKSLGMTSESGYINYTISIFVKDGRYKYEITNFYHTGQPKSPVRVGNSLVRGGIPDYGACEDMINTKHRTMGVSRQKTYDLYLEQMNENILSLIADIKDTMSKPAQSIDEDW